MPLAFTARDVTIRRVDMMFALGFEQSQDRTLKELRRAFGRLKSRDPTEVVAGSLLPGTRRPSHYVWFHLDHDVDDDGQDYLWFHGIFSRPPPTAASEDLRKRRDEGYTLDWLTRKLADLSDDGTALVTFDVEASLEPDFRERMPALAARPVIAGFNLLEPSGAEYVGEATGSGLRRFRWRGTPDALRVWLTYDDNRDLGGADPWKSERKTVAAYLREL